MSVDALRHVKNLEGDLMPSERLLLWVLADFHNTQEKAAWPSVKTLSKHTGISDRHIQTLLKGMVAKGVLVVEQRVRPDQSNTSNIYRFPGLDVGAWGGDVTSPGGDPDSTTRTLKEPTSKTTNKEKFAKVLEQYPNSRSEVVDPDKYFRSFDADLDFDPDNVVAAIRIGDLVRGDDFRQKERIRVPVPSRWSGLDRVGAFFRRQNGKLDLPTVGMVLEDMTDRVKAGPAWDNVLDILATYPEVFLDTYREAAP